MAVGFTAVYREGFETALFYQSLLTFGEGLGWYILLGVGLACVALAGVAYAVFKLGRKLPVRTFMNTAVVLVMVTSVALLGNAVHTLQAADVITFRRTSGPRLPIFLAEATGIWPTVWSLLAQAILATVYVFGALLPVRRSAPDWPTAPVAPARPAHDAVRARRRRRRGHVHQGGRRRAATREIVASAVVPTTHTAAGGVAAGVVDAVAKLAAEVGAEQIELVTHSTTQAVNALLEGDAGEVGVIGMGRRPDLGRWRSAPGCATSSCRRASTCASATSSSTSPTACRSRPSGAR